MSASAPDAYLRNAVLTATPEQLQLMLYDGAIRFARQGRDALDGNDLEGGFNSLSRAQKIVLELQGGLRREVSPELCDQMSQLYTFIYRRLVDASVNRDIAALDEAIELLEYQRETWKMLLERVADERGAEAPQVPQPAPVEPGMGGCTLSVEG